MKFITHSPEETIAFASSIGEKLTVGTVIAYKGGLGAGKTTFTRGLSIGLGLGDNVTSPTFALVNEYLGDKISLYHFDMYRINDVDELENTGFYDYPLENSVFVVEWSENIIKFLPSQNTVTITINRIDDNSREIIVEGLE